MESFHLYANTVLALSVHSCQCHVLTVTCLYPFSNISFQRFYRVWILQRAESRRYDVIFLFSGYVPCIIYSIIAVAAVTNLR